MIHIKSFIDKMSSIEARKTKDVVLPLADAKGLRDDLIRLLLELNELKTHSISENSAVSEIKISGGTFK